MKTHSELIASVRRELSMRMAVYPRRVISGNMSPDKAEHEIQCFKEILEIIEGANNQKQLSLDDTNTAQP